MRRVVLITGCSSGFGRELVPAFLGAEWTVVATLRNANARGDLFGDERRLHGARLHVLPLDVTRADERETARRYVEEHFDGRLDALVNNAGYAAFGSLEDLTEEALRTQLEVNFFGAALLTRTLLPALRKARGRILQLSSVFGYHGFPLTGAYCASKFALEGLSESLAGELAPFGVQVSLVEPGGHDTRFGDNVDWANGGPSSLYAGQTDAYRRFRERQRQRGRAPSANVVNAVVRLASSRRRMPLRVQVGKDARLVRLLHAWLPGRLQAWLFGAVNRRVFGATPGPVAAASRAQLPPGSE